MAPHTCIDFGRSCIVGRIHEQAHLLPGNFAGSGVNAVLNAAHVAKSSGESLDVQPGCMVTWLAFAGGNPIPEGAIEGGHLDDGGVRQPLYIMSVMHSGRDCSMYGYYNPATGLGYAEFHGIFSVSHMNLMILMQWNLITREPPNLTWRVCVVVFKKIYISSHTKI